MKKNFNLASAMTIFYMLFACSTPSHNTDEETKKDKVVQSDKELTVKFVNRSKGNIYMALFKSADGFPSDQQKTFKSLTIKPVDKSFSFKKDFETIAISAFIDSNGNGKLDTNALGVPVEPFAFSNNPTIVFSAPSFEASKIDPNVSSIDLEFKTF